MSSRLVKLATALMSGLKPVPKRVALRDRQFESVGDDEVDYEFESPSQFFGTHVNLIPLQSAVAGPRLFYGARFYNQALPLKNAEAPLVQARAGQDPNGEDSSFDDVLGRYAGAVRADGAGQVLNVTSDEIEIRDEAGETRKVGLYNRFPFNRKTQLHNTALVKPGDTIVPGQVLAKSNYTDDKGALAMGVNARVGVVPYFGRSMDDAIVISEAFARRLTSNHLYGHDLDYKRGVKGGKAHYMGVFPQEFTNEQLKKVDDDGVVQVGQELQPGDPIILATKPRVVSSTNAQLGLLSKHMRNARQNAATVWDKDTVGRVVDVEKLRSGVKVNIETDMPAKEGDKIVFRSGQKGIISHVIPDEQMPRTVDGNPLEVLLNPLGVPSRMNNSLIYELLLGKVAQKLGKAYKMDAFNQPNEKWYDIVKRALDEAGVTDTEEVFDPQANKKLENPITVGVGHVLKLHHTSESKISARGQGAYTCYDDQTEVLTARGWIPWSDASRDDLLATLDGSNMVFEKPVDLHSYDYNGDLVGFQGKYLDWLVTPNHRHWVKFKKPSSKFRFETADSLFKRKFYVRQFGFETIGSNPEQFELGCSVSKRSDNRKQHHRGFKCRFEDYAAFVGWWVSEGSVAKGSNGYLGKVFIHQSLEANTENFETIRRLMSRMGLQAWEHKNTDGKVVGLVCCHRALAEHLVHNFGNRAKHKRLSPLLLHASVTARRALFTALMAGDGRKDGSSYATSSKRLADDVQILAISIGVGGVVHTASEAGSMVSPTNGKTYAQSTAYLVGISRARSGQNALVENYVGRSSKHYRQRYFGKVYCATMRTGLLYVRRNGKPMLSGNSDQQPLHGGSEAGKSKRLSGLETHSLLSSGAYNILREGATLRGQRNDEYWRMLRQGYEPRPPGAPFVWDKFKTLLQGSGYQTKNLGSGRIRLQFWTDRDLDDKSPIEVKTGDLLDIGTLQPVKGGLFDDSLTGANAWGYIPLPHPVPNPAAEDVIRKLLGLTEKQFRAILAGEAELPEHLRFKKPNQV